MSLEQHALPSEGYHLPPIVDHINRLELTVVHGYRQIAHSRFLYNIWYV